MGSTLCLFMFMRFLLLNSPFHLMVANSSSSMQQPLCHDSESSALLQFKQSFLLDEDASDDPSAYPKVATWKSHGEGEGSDCCSWDGVECDRETGHVIGLHLASSCLYGSNNSSSTLFSLVHLQRLDLSDNYFHHSEIPNGIGHLSRLRSLNLSYSRFSGQIPSSLGQLPRLSYLDLSYNKFSGQIPSFMANLTQLSYLDLSANNFSGQIPSFMANLTQLTCLYLSWNDFKVGTLSWVGKQTKLTSLGLRQINLNGEIPSSFLNMSQLTFLSLGENQLSGQIPSWLMNLTQLTKLFLDENELEGSIPSSFFELVNLQWLWLDSNYLNGTVELHVLSKLKNLTNLQLSDNRLSLLSYTSTNATFPKFKVLGLASCNLTEFPDFLQNQDELEILSLSDNKIHGPIPKWMWNISKETLGVLDLSGNFLTGFDQRPVVLPWSRLYRLKLDSNMLQGSLPVPPPSTLFYSVFENKLTGEIPQLICNTTSLMLLDLSSNNLSGGIPPCLANFSKLSLSILDLGSNNLDGPIPQTCTEPNNLRVIDLSENQFQGQIPRSLANCTMLEHLVLGNNQIDDIFPFWLGALPQLHVLILRSNKFHGTIGSWHTNFRFPKLRIIDLSYNEFIGDLPSEYFQNWDAMKLVDANHIKYMEVESNFRFSGYMWTSSYMYSMTMTNKGMQRFYEEIPDIFVAIDFSGNNFKGYIPTSIGSLKGLHLLNLGGNNLTGHIPSSLGSLTQLESLDLSQNKLSGEIPWQLTRMTFLEFFNASNNHLTGPIPQGKQFDTFQNESYQGNPGLCGGPLSKKCSISKASPLPPSTSRKVEDSKLGINIELMMVLMGYGSGLVVGVVIGHTLTIRKHEWFVEKLGKRQRRGNKRGRGN